ncbi:MAG: hypothetical protein KHW56_00980 [Clostridiales bacterium]|nr:hypothetical protein [Clostridiales bacterium]
MFFYKEGIITRRILCVILLGGLLLTMLSGCTSREPSPESGSESRTASASEPLSPEDPFYEEVLRTLGAEKTEDGLLVATPCSLLTVNWAEPEDLEGYRYCHWYMEQLSDLPAEEKRARYTPPEGETGWLIPAEELENALRESFTAADPAFLREQAAYYDTDAGQYHALLTGGRGSGLTYWAAPLRQNGDTWTVLLSGANAEGTRVRGSLTVLRQDDDPVRLVSWNPDRSTMS